MKKIILSLLFISSISFAQNGINYQGAATDADGAKLVNQNISLKTSVLQGGVDGTTSYSETHNTTTDQFGLFNVVIGLGNIIEGSFDSIQWGADSHFLKVELDATGGTNYSLVSTTQMMNVPYALYAHSVNKDFIENTIDEINGEPTNNDFNDSFLNSDFENDEISSLTQEFDGKMIILFSTAKSIYFTDSTGSFTNKIYSTNDNNICCLTLNETKDTLYFLQSNNSSDNALIMMTALSNFNPIVIGTTSCDMNHIDKFKYYNGDFYYRCSSDDDGISVLSNNNLAEIGTANNVRGFEYNQNGLVYSYYSGGANYPISGAVSIGNLGTSLADITYADELGIYLGYSNNNNISIYELPAGSILFTTGSGPLNAGDNYKNRIVRFYDNTIYFSSRESLVAVDYDDINTKKIIAGTSDGLQINGIVILNYEHQETTDQIYANNENKNQIYFSTDKSIYFLDTIATSSLNKIYSTNNNNICCLTLNETKDTLYFLQSNNSSDNALIMMTALSNFNPIVIGTTSCDMNHIDKFKYYNGDFYYRCSSDDDGISVLSNNNLAEIGTANNVRGFEYNQNGLVYSYYSGGANYPISGAVSIGNLGTSLADITYADELGIYLGYSNNNNISIYELPAGSILFTTGSGPLNAGDNYKNRIVRFYDNTIYFSSRESLVAVDYDDINTKKIIAGTSDGLQINGIVIK